MPMFERFRDCEDGAVTVDWVVLTAVIVLLVAAGTVGVVNGSGTLAEQVGSYLASITVG